MGKRLKRPVKAQKDLGNVCASCLKPLRYVKAAGVFFPYNGDEPIPYLICEACRKEAHSCLEHNEAVMLGIEDNLEKAGLIR